MTSVRLHVPPWLVSRNNINRKTIVVTLVQFLAACIPRDVDMSATSTNPDSYTDSEPALRPGTNASTMSPSSLMYYSPSESWFIAHNINKDTVAVLSIVPIYSAWMISCLALKLAHVIRCHCGSIFAYKGTTYKAIAISASPCEASHLHLLTLLDGITSTQRQDVPRYCHWTDQWHVVPAR